MRHLWRILFIAGLLATAAYAQAQNDRCAAANILASFQSAVEGDSVEAWAQGYGECPVQIQRGVATMARGYRALWFQTPVLEGVIPFDGEDDYAVIPFVEAFKVTEFTVEAWVYPEKVEVEWQTLVAKESEAAAERNFGLYIAPGGLQIHASLYGEDCWTNFHFVSRDSLVLNDWNHVAMTFDGIVIRMYLNGILDSEQVYGGGVCQSAQPIIFGGYPDIYSQFRGQMAEIHLWDHARSEQEISEGMYATLTGDEPGLVGNWQMDDVESGIVYDRARGNHGVMRGR